MSKKVLVSVPSHGLGDVLYHSLALQYLKESKYDDCIIFCPPNCIEIPGLVGITAYPYYSKLLKNKLALTHANEVRFWRILSRYRGSGFFSTYNDLIDKFLCSVYGFEMVNGSIGNYFKAFRYGARSSFNVVLSLKKSDPVTNPKHFFERIHNVVSALTNVSQEDLGLYFKKKVFQIAGGGVLAMQASVLIFPDAGTEARMLNHQQVKCIVESYRKDAEIMIYSNREFKFDGKTHVRVRRFSSIKDTIKNTFNASVVFTADSFPAHFSALCGVKTMVIYQHPKFKKYCEYWGPPFNNVFHFEDGVGYTLDEHYKAVETTNIIPGTDFSIAKTVSSLHS